MSVITASRYADTLVGTSDPDTITGSAGPDSIAGGPGADSIVSGAGFGDDATPDTLRGGAGNDVISQVGGYGGLLFGDNGDDTLTHAVPAGLSLGYYVLEGGPGIDVLQGTGADNIDVWAGYLTATGGVHVDLSITGQQDVGGGAGFDTLIRMTGVLGSSFGDTLTGGSNAREELFGGPGDDVLRAGAAGGVLHGDTGNDTLIGGSGADWADYGPSVFKLNLTFLPRTTTWRRDKVLRPKLSFSSAYTSDPARRPQQSTTDNIVAMTSSRSSVRRRSCASMSARIAGKQAPNPISR